MVSAIGFFLGGGCGRNWEVGSKYWWEVERWLQKYVEVGIGGRWILKIGGRLAPENGWD